MAFISLHTATSSSRRYFLDQPAQAWRKVPKLVRVRHQASPILASHHATALDGTATAFHPELRIALGKAVIPTQFLAAPDGAHGDEVPKAVRARRKRWDEGIGYQEREIFELFLKLPVPQRKVAREVIVALARANGVLPLAAGS